MNKLLYYMKLAMKRLLFTKIDAEDITNWDCYLFWFSISVILVSAVLRYT